MSEFKPEIKNCKDIKMETITALVIGDSGTGKTRLLRTLPEDSLIISLEKGLLSLKGIDIPYIQIPEGLGPKEKLDWLKNSMMWASKQSYKNIAIDSITEMSEFLVDFGKIQYPADNQIFKVYGQHKEQLTSSIKYCRDMNKNIFFTCLVKTDNDGIGRKVHLPSVAGSLAEEMPKYFDFVFYLEVFEKDGQKKRALLTEKKPENKAKDRSGKLDEWEAPDLSNIINKINGIEPKQQEQKSV